MTPPPENVVAASPVRFKAFGAGGALSQVERIKDGLLACGAAEAGDGPVDLVYCNDSGTHHMASEWRAKRASSAKLILNVLDVPEHLMPSLADHPGWPPDHRDYTHDKLVSLQQHLLRADAITAISPFTRAQLQRLLGLGSYLIWNPIKPVSPDKRLAGECPYPYRVLISGRAGDPNKRVRSLAVPALIAAGFAETEVAVVGGEWVGWGTNLGVVSDEMLNDLLNSVDLTMHTTQLTGLELGPIESIVCGAVPILCYDMSTFRDLPYPQHWGCHPSVASIACRLRSLVDHPEVLQAEREHCLHLSEGLREDLSGRAVAQRILGVYHRLVNPSPTS